MADVYLQSQHLLDMSIPMKVDGNQQIKEFGKILPREGNFCLLVWLCWGCPLPFSMLTWKG